MDSISLIWLILIFVSFVQPILQQRILVARRVSAIRRLETRRKSRVITLIHRQEGISFFGLRLGRFIDIDDSEALLRAIELTDPSVPLDLVVHTPGGLVLASEQIARALSQHEAKVTVIVPHYAMSGGTMIALAADEIPHVALGGARTGRSSTGRLSGGLDPGRGGAQGRQRGRRPDADLRRHGGEGASPGARLPGAVAHRQRDGAGKGGGGGDHALGGTVDP